jgi:hypothetical protein
MQASVAETQEDELAKRLYAGSGHRLAANSPPRSMRIGAAGKMLSALDTRGGAQSSGVQSRYTNASAQQQALIPKLLWKNGAAAETNGTDLMSSKARADAMRGAGTGAHSVASMRSTHAASSAIVLGGEPSSVYLRSNKMSPKRSTSSTLAAAASASHSPVRRHNGQMLYSADDSNSLTQSHHGGDKLHNMNTGSAGSLHNIGNSSSSPERTATAAAAAVAADATDDDGTFLMSLGLSDDQFDELFNSVNGNFLYLSQKPGMDATAYDLQVGISLTYNYL